MVSFIIEPLKERIEETLRELSSLQSPLFSSLYEGGRYALLSSGKRIRPLLTLLAVEMIQKDALEKALRPACALEMVHTYSLIHDDLPSMDNDDFRRGKPTLHRVYTEGHAILIGDNLLTSAFEVLSDAPDLTPHQKIALVKALALAAGGDGMIGGQVMDIEKSMLFDETHLRKTAALFRAALEFAAIITDVAPSVKTLLALFGTQFGLLFQIVDDIVDQDCLLETDAAIEMMELRHTNALKTLHSLPFDTELLCQLTDWIISQAGQGVAKIDGAYIVD